MGSTTFSGPVTSLNGFIGTVTGNITGNITGNVTGDLTGRVFGTVTTRSGAGAVPITAGTVRLTTTGADALTLANGANGQILSIVMVADGGDGTLTPTTKTGFSTITFDAVGDSVTLQYFTTLGWMILANNGATVA
jgi:hypothetical protein